MKRTISMFDWNGELDKQVKEDELVFEIKLTDRNEDCMGFKRYDIEGEEGNIENFLNYYQLELDPPPTEGELQ